jgi:hypothetical protein
LVFSLAVKNFIWQNQGKILVHQMVFKSLQKIIIIDKVWDTKIKLGFPEKFLFEKILSDLKMLVRNVG